MQTNSDTAHSAKRTLDQEIRERFDRAEVAQSYRRAKNDRKTSKNRRELTCISRALEGIGPGSKILDLPTGTGRLLPMLAARGVQIIAADYSRHMLEQAGQLWQQQSELQKTPKNSRVRFEQQDIMSINLVDKAVDVTICNRLFHHYPTPQLRRQALSELRRVTSRRIVLSYFSNVAVSAGRFHLKNAVTRRTPTDRIPIWPAIMRKDIEACGLTIEQVQPVLWGLSPQTYLVIAVPTV